MKLSEAILKGSEKNKQCFDGHFGLEDDGKITTCALSAGAVAEGIIDDQGKFDKTNPNVKLGWDSRTGGMSYQMDMPADWSSVTDELHKSPCGCEFSKSKQSGTDIIWHLNDYHHWTREAVALWVETLENEIEKNKAQEQPAQVANGNTTVCGQEEAEAQEVVDMYNDVYGTVKV